MLAAAGPVGFWSDKLPQIKTRVNTKKKSETKVKVWAKCSRQVVSEARLQPKLHCECNQQPAKDIFKSNSIWVLAFWRFTVPANRPADSPHHFPIA